METHGPLGVIWVGTGLIAFYIGLTWVNLLLGHLLTPLILLPLTFLRKPRAGEAERAEGAARG